MNLHLAKKSNVSSPNDENSTEDTTVAPELLNCAYNTSTPEDIYAQITTVIKGSHILFITTAASELLLYLSPKYSWIHKSKRACYMSFKRTTQHHSFNFQWNAHIYNTNAEEKKRSGGTEFHILAWNEEDDRNEDKEGDGVGGAGERADTGIGKEGAGDFEEATGVAGAVCRRSKAASRLFFFSDAAADASAADSTIAGEISSPPHLQPMSCSLPVHDGLKFQFLSKRPLIVDNQVQNLAQIMLPLNQIYNYPCCHRHNQRLIHKPPENNYALIGKGKDTAPTIRSIRSAPAKNRETQLLIQNFELQFSSLYSPARKFNKWRKNKI